MLATGELRLVLLGALARRHPAWSRDPRTGRGARRGDRRAPGLSPRGRERSRRGARGRDSASRCRRPRRRAARSVRGRDARAQISRRTCWWARSRRRTSPMPQPRRGGARRPRSASWRSRPTRRGAAARTRRASCRSPPSPRPRAPRSTSRDAGRALRARRVPPGEARPGWKVLRVLANLLGLTGFDYLSSEDVRDELRARWTGMLRRAARPRARSSPAS